MATNEPSRGENSAATETFWNERYGSADRIWSGEPNPQLVSEVAGLPEGRALDVGAGEGADAIWLATNGWEVCAADISGVALARGRAEAEAIGNDIAARITWEHVDLTAWTPPSRAFDLVAVHFLHLPSQERDPLYRRCAEAVADGGTLLIVGHHPSDLETSVRRPPNPDLLFTAESVAGLLDDDWQAEAHTRPRSAVDADGAAVTVHDAVLVATRVAGRRS